MGSITEDLGAYVQKTGINLVKMSKETGIAYEALYSSLLNKNRRRELRVEEFFKICKFIERNPMDFVDANELLKGLQEKEAESV